jgi:Flp pilus assembly protein TadB
MSYTKFTSLVKDLDKKGKELNFQVNEVNDIEGRKESTKLQLISNHYQYLIFFFFCIIVFLFMIRLYTYDTGIIDTIILIIALLLFIHFLYYKYFNNTNYLN